MNSTLEQNKELLSKHCRLKPKNPHNQKITRVISTLKVQLANTFYENLL